MSVEEMAAKIAERLKNEACDCEWARGTGKPICVSENFDEGRAAKILAEELRRHWTGPNQDGVLG